MEKEIKTVYLIGLGAVGVLYAQLLSGHIEQEDLRIVADAGRIEKYRAEGIYCNGKKCDFPLADAGELTEPADLILFTVKYTGLDGAIETMRPLVGENTVVLSAVNGISSEEKLAAAYGAEHILYAVAQGMDAVKTKNQMTYTQTGMLVFGDCQPGIISGQARRVKRFFERVQFPHELVTNMLDRQWGKLMLNVGLNQCSAVFGTSYGDLQRPCEARDIMVGAMREVMAVSGPEGHPLREEDLNYWLGVLDALNPAGKPSMAQDAEAGRPSEVELFAGTICRLGRKHGIHTPFNDFLYEKIQEMERGYMK
ncbi:ketopantoate reductase family protein [Anaerolentibacter hominis]|uniref:ketopantoate reductase family protein n=1 Tax=Anaerolentibacter hominis TaxID=3079009 RepID=UPI0031B88E7E